MKLLKEQYKTNHHAGTSTNLSVELGFLLHMMDLTALTSRQDGKSRCVQPTNFLRAFRRSPRVVALGLTLSPGSSSSTQGGTLEDVDGTGNTFDSSGNDAEMNKLTNAMCEAAHVASTLVNTQVTPTARHKLKNHKTNPSEVTARDEHVKQVAKEALLAAENVFNKRNGDQNTINNNEGDDAVPSLSLSQIAESFCRFIITEVK